MTERPISHRGADDGAALLLALVAAAFIAALSLATVVVWETERRIQATFDWSIQTQESAAAGIDRVTAELATIQDWSTALNGTFAGPQDPGTQVRTPAGLNVDLEAARRDLQADWDNRSGGAPNRPVWRLFESGTARRLTGGSVSAIGAVYLAIWIADDSWERDDDPAVDSNGVVELHAAAWGPSGATAAIEATIAHGPGQPGCVMAARLNYDSGSPRLSVVSALRAGTGASAGRRGSGIVLAASQVSGVDDPCRVSGPGAVIVTWREVG